MRKMRKNATASIAFIATAAVVAVAVAAPSNGGFESGTLEGWETKSRGAGLIETYQGEYDPGASPRRGLSALPAPPKGEWAAAISQQEPSANFLHRVLEMKRSGKTKLTLWLAYSNAAGVFATPNHLDYDRPPSLRGGGGSGEPNQQLRIDLVKKNKPLGTVKPKHLKARLFRTEVGDPVTQPYQKLSWNLSKLGVKGKFRLRIAEVDNQEVFRVGVDGVKLKKISRDG